MSLTTAHVSMSLDGFIAGPGQSLDEPLGLGGLRLHGWHLADVAEQHPADAEMTRSLLRPRGAYLMGRNMFGPVRGEWGAEGLAWNGWWGDDPPYHAPVVVLTHHEREPVEMAGGTTFHFVTGFEEGLRRARELGDDDVHIAGGAATIRQALVAGEVDEVTLDIAPVTLGSGERIFPDGQVDLGWEPVEVVASPLATHVRYRVARP